MSEEEQNINKEYLDALRRLSYTGDGLIVLEWWRQQYVCTSSVGKTPEMTYYFLGIKEFVQDIINEVSEEPYEETLNRPENEDSILD